MTRKRRMFEIDMPVEAGAEAPLPSSKKPGRSPMAAAITENAEALTARKSAAEAIREENDALAHEFVALREAGHVVREIPLEDVHTYMLVRDRIPGEDLELESLVTSIKDLGLSNPIRVLERPDGTGYELVQGYRRLSAYKALAEAEKGQGGHATIPALILPGEADIAGLYRRMVDENVIRKDLSFAEMAHAAQNYAADPATEANDVNSAVAALFQSAAYSKRSYIRSFAMLLERLEGVLNYPTEIPRALGVTLAREMKDNPEIAGRIKQDLKGLGQPLDQRRARCVAPPRGAWGCRQPRRRRNAGCQAEREGQGGKAQDHLPHPFQCGAGEVYCGVGAARDQSRPGLQLNRSRKT